VKGLVHACHFSFLERHASFRQRGVEAFLIHPTLPLKLCFAFHREVALRYRGGFATEPIRGFILGHPKRGIAFLVKASYVSQAKRARGATQSRQASEMMRNSKYDIVFHPRMKHRFCKAERFCLMSRLRLFPALRFHQGPASDPTSSFSASDSLYPNRVKHRIWNRVGHIPESCYTSLINWDP
jgi:hypothetical protein